MVKPQDSGQPRFGSVGEPGAGRNEKPAADEHPPGTRKPRGADSAPTTGIDRKPARDEVREHSPRRP